MKSFNLFMVQFNLNEQGGYTIIQRNNLLITKMLSSSHRVSLSSKYFLANYFFVHILAVIVSNAYS